MNVVTALNENYVPYTYVMLFSLFENNSRHIHVYLLQENLSDASKEALQKLCLNYNNEISFVEMHSEDFDERLLATKEWSMETCFRLAMNDVLPKGLDRVIYLDGDMIINKDISDLYDKEFSAGKHLIVTHDMTMTPDSDDVYGKLHTDVFRKMIRNNQYFNAGMILMDFSYLQRKYHFRDYISLAEKLNFEIFAPDQDLLNFMHKDETEYVDAWQYDLFACNAFIRGYDYSCVKEKVSIIHFVGEKPWSGGTHFHYDIEALWWDYANQVIYANDLRQSFMDGYFGDSSFYDAIHQAEEMNQALKDKLQETMQAFGKLYQMLFGKEVGGLVGDFSSNKKYYPELPKKKDISKFTAEEEMAFVYEIINDNSIQQYVDELRVENETLQVQLNQAIESYHTLKQSV